ncbi:hypothetical protein UA70_15600 [Raoultella planticola]|nr:hypothetical protein UA70_15600 [Raoultella planticola]
MAQAVSPLPEIIYAEHGKPGFSGETGLWFNLSHSGDDIALLFSDEGEVGCDIEVIRPRPNWRRLLTPFQSWGACGSRSGASGAAARRLLAYLDAQRSDG